MSINQTDWSKFLLPGSDLPPDVTFRVVETVGAEEEQPETVSVHRLLLAGVSPVFRKQFFGPMKTTWEKVEAKETTTDAFTTMINYIYKPNVSKRFSLHIIK